MGGYCENHLTGNSVVYFEPEDRMCLATVLTVVSGPEMCVMEQRRNTALGSSVSTEEMSGLEQKTCLWRVSDMEEDRQGPGGA